MDTDRNLLFGVLALQADLIDPGRFAEACTAWSARKQAPLADLLVERGWLTPQDRADVERLLERKLRKHKGDARAGLAEATPDHVRRSLAGLTDPDIRQALTDTPAPPGHVPVSTTDFEPEARDRYSLSRLHATGGIGRVWLARDRSLGRDVALKELRPERAARPDLRARFVQEARVTGQLEHPGVVPIYEVGRRPDDGQPFYTMRFVRGRTLAEAADAYHRLRLRGKAGLLEFRGLLTAFAGVCNAVAYAHARGVIHRDLKPQNVVLGDYGEVIVLDWGLARLVDAPDGSGGDAPAPVEAAGEPVVTAQGQALGTPSYMAPEQAEGRLDLLGTRTDVYGLGAILYECLTGRPPFPGEDTSRVLRRVVHEQPAPPRSVVERTPPALEAVCLKALAKSPADRYESAKALASEVERWMADEPVSAWREPLRVRAGRWVRRHRTAVATALAALAVAVVGLVGVAAVQARARRELADTNRQLEQANVRLAESRDRAERRVDLAVGAIDNFRSAVDGNLDVKNRPENEALRKTLLQAPLAFYQKLRDDLRGGGEAGPEARSRLADAYLRLAALDRDIGSQADALSAYDQAVALLESLAREAPGPDPEGPAGKLAAALGDRGALQGESGGMTEAALESFRNARQLQEDHLRRQPGDTAARLSLARVLVETARLQARGGKVEEALASLHGSLDVAGELRHKGPEDVGAALLFAEAHGEISRILLDQRSRLPEALASAQTALGSVEPLARARTADLECQRRLAEAYERLGFVHKAQGDPAKALEAYGKELSVVEGLVRALPTVNPFRLKRVSALRAAALMKTRLGRHAESLADFRKSREQAEELVRDNPTNAEFKKELAAACNDMALPLYALGKVAESLASVEAGAAALDELVRTNPRDLVTLRTIAGARFNCGYLNYELGRVGAALAAYDESLRLRERLHREQPDDARVAFEYASTLGNVADLRFDRRRFAEAERLFRQEVGVLERLAADHPESADYPGYLARARLGLARTLAEEGRAREGLGPVRAGLAVFERTAREQPGVVQNQSDLALGLQYLGEVLRKSGQPDEAAAAGRKAAEAREKLLESNPENVEFRYKLVEALLRAGAAEQDRDRAADAVADYRKGVGLLGALSSPTPDQIYLLACCHARLAGVASKASSGLRPDEGSAEADKAVATLRRAVAAGYNNVENLRDDPDIDALRQREDFRKLVHEAEAKVRERER